MQKSLALVLVAAVLLVGLSAALWFTLRGPADVGATEVAGVRSARQPADGSEQAALAEPRARDVELAGAALAAGERSQAEVAVDEVDPDTAHRIAGRIVFPAGMARDDSLRIVAIGHTAPLAEAADGDAAANVITLDDEGESRRVAPKSLPHGVKEALEDDLPEDQTRAIAAVGADGRFELLVAERCRSAYLSLDARHLYLEEPVAVALENGEPAAATLEPLLGARIVGRASVPTRPAEEQDLAGTEVSLMVADDDEDGFSFMGSGGDRHAVEIGEDLSFEMRGLPPSEGVVLTTEPEAFLPVLRSKIVLRAGQDTEVLLEHDLGARVSGRVVDETGEPIEGARVTRDSNGFGFGMRMGGQKRTETDADGRFALRGLRPGKTVVEAEKKGHVPAKSEERALVEGEELSGVELVLATGLALRGRVIWPDGTPAAEARIDVTGRETPAGQPWNRKRLDERCDEDGRFAIAGLEDESFDLVASSVARGAGDEGEAARREAEARALAESAGAGGARGAAREAMQRMLASRDQQKLPRWTVRVEDVRPGGAELLLTLEEPLAISGRVEDETGAPLDEFSVEASPVRDGDGWWTQSTSVSQDYEDAGGRFELDGLQPGRYRLTPKAKRHALQDAAREIEVPYQGEPLVLVLPRAARVAGVVLDPAGAPVANASVRTGEAGGTIFGRGRQWTTEFRSATTDESGAFELDLPASETQLTASADGWARSEPLALDLVPAAELENLVLHLTLGGTLTGEVYRPDGSPQAGAKVMANGMGGGDGATGRADDAGRFTIEHLSPGTYQVMVEPEIDQVASMMEGGGDGDFSQVFEALKMSSAEIVDGKTTHVVLGAPPRAPVRVVGRVTDGGEPVGGRMLVAMAEGQAMMAGMKMTQTDEDGRFELELREPGPVMFTLQLGTSSSNPQWFEDVPEVERYEVAFELPAGRVAGTVVGPDGRPLAGVEVRLGREGGEAYTMLSFNSRVTTDSDGRFAFVNVEPGEYSLRAGGSSMFGGSASYGTALVSGIRLGEGDRREDVRIRLEAAGEIRGRVVDASGKPATDAAVFVRDSDGRLVDSFTATQTDAGGRFTYRGIAPGSYTVSARGKTEACADGPRITVRSAETAEVELALEPATMVVVTIESAAGVASRARVRVLDEEGREYAAMTTPAAMEAAFTQGFSTREHRIGPVPAGSYTVIATTFDGVEKKKPVTLRGQEERRVRLDLE